MYYDISSLPSSQQFLLDKIKTTVKLEEMAGRINSLDDLYKFKAGIMQSGPNITNRILSAEIQKKIDAIIMEAVKNQIDIPATFMKFIKAEDSNVVFEYLTHLKENTLTGDVALDQ